MRNVPLHKIVYLINFGNWTIAFHLFHMNHKKCLEMKSQFAVNKVLYCKVMHKYLFLREKRATDALGN